MPSKYLKNATTEYSSSHYLYEINKPSHLLLFERLIFIKISEKTAYFLENSVDAALLV